MPDREDSIEQKHFRVSVQVAVMVALFVICTVGAAAAWAQNITNHLSNVDSAMAAQSVDQRSILLEVQKMNVLQERTLRIEERLARLEDWRIRELQTQNRLR